MFFPQGRPASVGLHSSACVSRRFPSNRAARQAEAAPYGAKPDLTVPPRDCVDAEYQEVREYGTAGRFLYGGSKMTW